MIRGCAAVYLALYRKYRPKTFDDVISQPQIVTTLKNQIATGQNTHAYLFTGSRGTGKTTCAKILAMALNCKHPVNGNPCLECESCREIENGTATDVVEMDAASNNKVEDVHLLQDQLAYTPVSCKYRVYIVDEVHMLTASAFNALLKTIEEPPAHVIFILATTELHKVPATIVSRCQRFEFRRIEIADSSARLMSVAENEGVTLTSEAADMISRISDGGMRDALSLLDRCISVNGNVTGEVVRECAGAADNHHLYQFAEMIAARDIPGCIKLLEQLYKAGKDISRVMDELSGVFRDLMICSSAPGEKELLSAMPGDRPEIERLAGMFTLNEILRSLTVIQECTDGISKTRQCRTLAEMCFVKLCTGASAAAQAAYAPAPASVPKPVQKPAEYKPMGSEFAPLPDEKLQPKQAAAVNELRKIFEPALPAPSAEKPAEKSAPVRETAPEAAAKADIAANQSKLHELISQNAPAAPGSGSSRGTQNITTQPEKPAAKAAPAMEDAPLPVLNSAPAAPEPMDLAPPPEEPPMEFIPQREFDIAPQAEPPAVTAPEAQQAPPETAVPAPLKQETAQAKPEPAPGKKAGQKPEQPAPEKPQEPAEKPEKHSDAGQTGYEKLTSITDEEWRSVLKKVSPMYEAMLDDASVSVNGDGVLEIRSGNLMLHGMTNGALEQELEAGFGRKIRAVVMDEEKEKAAGEEISAVKKLLDKAKQLNIEVQIK